MKLIYEGRVTGVSHNQEVLQRLFPFWQASSLAVYPESGTRENGTTWEGLAVCVQTCLNKAPRDDNRAARKVGFIPDVDKERVRALCAAEGMTTDHLYGRIRSMGSVTTDTGPTFGIQVEFYLPPAPRSQKEAPNGPA